MRTTLTSRLADWIGFAMFGALACVVAGFLTAGIMYMVAA